VSRHAYDVLVIGGGHAGAEAAWAASRIGARTALITFQRDAIGRMSCNPAIGGIGKGQIVREVDALGGLMGLVADETGIQFRILNRRKGPAVWAPRCQSDREQYALAVQRRLASCPNLEIIEAAVESILAGPLSSERRALRIAGVELAGGRRLDASTVVVTSGTFLRGLMHTGERKTAGGRIGEAAAVGLSGSLAALGLKLGRLKTGTPPRLHRDSLDYAQLGVQPGDDPPVPFSFLNDRIAQPQVVCWTTFTNPAVHEIIRANLHRAPMYSGQIQSVGPRYCPSIEDKVVRFAEKTAHQIFLEPEGRDCERIYVNGISTSLPEDVQREIVARIEGLENARILQWGYAVEYDFVPPEQIDASLMTRRVAGLFLAGQINGTSGYEEAAGQGIVAGINAARFAANCDPVILRRDQAYIGVMIDDLVTRGLDEPYRMFTSRAEHRLHLRCDNADSRLTPLGREIGLVDDTRWNRFRVREARVAALVAHLRAESNCDSLARRVRRPDEDLDGLLASIPEPLVSANDRDTWARAIVEIRYDGYIQRQQRLIDRDRALEERIVPSGFNFSSIKGLRKEAAERWNRWRPRTVAQAGRIPGIHPTDVSLLLVSLVRSTGCVDA
jgi:tRNA uridine 5-carboxymethylaminomethyl modification enzyme